MQLKLPISGDCASSAFKIVLIHAFAHSVNINPIAAEKFIVALIFVRSFENTDRYGVHLLKSHK